MINSNLRVKDIVLSIFNLLPHWLIFILVRITRLTIDCFSSKGLKSFLLFLHSRLDLRSHIFFYLCSHSFISSSTISRLWTLEKRLWQDLCTMAIEMKRVWTWSLNASSEVQWRRRPRKRQASPVERRRWRRRWLDATTSTPPLCNFTLKSDSGEEESW